MFGDYKQAEQKEHAHSRERREITIQVKRMRAVQS